MIDCAPNPAVPATFDALIATLDFFFLLSLRFEVISTHHHHETNPVRNHFAAIPLGVLICRLRGYYAVLTFV